VNIAVTGRRFANGDAMIELCGSVYGSRERPPSGAIKTAPAW